MVLTFFQCSKVFEDFLLKKNFSSSHSISINSRDAFERADTGSHDIQHNDIQRNDAHSNIALSITALGTKLEGTLTEGEGSAQL
jgi:hypothetical protein